MNNVRRKPLLFWDESPNNNRIIWIEDKHQTDGPHPQGETHCFDFGWSAYLVHLIYES